jgi:lipopolysaccharide/colanic/teichoic acid biosynthesis glycosyltransferase
MFIASWMGLKGQEDPRKPSNRWAQQPWRERYDRRPSKNGRRTSTIRVGPLTEIEEISRADRWKERLQRGLNVVVALVGILLAAPAMILVALAVKLTSPGPVIFKQARVGVDRRRYDPNVPVDPRRTRDMGGRIFQIYKFRTMYHCEESQNHQVWASPEDPRITPVGRLLRLYRLDELPQLFNVLRGDMNIVGPRPEQPEIFQDLRTQIEGYQRRQRVLPGITGLAQVNHRYDRSLDDVKRKVTLDLEYVRRRSAVEDLRIMVQTFPVILFRRGAC